MRPNDSSDDLGEIVPYKLYNLLFDVHLFLEQV